MDPAFQSDVEADLNSSFKAAALALTTLYKDSLKHSKNSYNQGYSQCLRDIMTFASQQSHRLPNTNTHVINVADLVAFMTARDSELQSLHQGSPSQRRSHPAPHVSGNSADTLPPSSLSAPVPPSQPAAQSMPTPSPPKPSPVEHHPNTFCPPSTSFTFTSTVTAVDPSIPGIPLIPMTQAIFHPPTPPVGSTESSTQSVLGHNQMMEHAMDDGHSDTGYPHHGELKRRWNPEFTAFGRSLGLDEQAYKTLIGDPSPKRQKWRRDDRMSD
ncbi:uncharacterized protein BJ171DRAFT_165891 [Polychytrium aggregatum]|uniref:uncharacterized protein n=1 Tax=Polychytrium aggregatum TaxID=110093 RepID=UPI0022FF3026|nr:uncharacterized protein BJ171DRAFT_165891 [Polychytrium aggregatum]KAI9202696.1 hypothetical protein BJ171DRAFT_165891 [Polychytrium aggregatum]